MSINQIPVVDPKRAYLGEQPVGKGWAPRGWWDFSDVRNPRLGVTLEVYADAQAYADGASLPDQTSFAIEGDPMRALMAAHPEAFATMFALAEAQAQARVGGVVEPADLSVYLDPPPEPEPEPEP